MQDWKPWEKKYPLKISLKITDVWLLRMAIMNGNEKKISKHLTILQDKMMKLSSLRGFIKQNSFALLPEKQPQMWVIFMTGNP